MFGRRGGPGPLPAPAFPLDQLMPSHRDRGFGQVEDRAALHPGDRPPGQARPAPCATARRVPQLPVRPGHLGQRAALMPVLAAGLRPVFFRSDRGRGRGGDLSSPSLDGGPDEFRGLCSAAPQAQRSAPGPAPGPPAPAPAQPATRPAPRAAPPLPHQRNQHYHRPHLDVTTSQVIHPAITHHCDPSSAPANGATPKAGSCQGGGPYAA